MKKTHPPTILQNIARSVENRLRIRQKLNPESELRVLIQTARIPHTSLEKFLEPGPHVIAEIKYASPSEGILMDPSRMSPAEIARDYLEAGATVLSILTEQDSFSGKLENLSQVRKAFPDAHLLMKDFVIEEYQLLEARIHGADWVLLIVALLGEVETQRLYEISKQLGLTVLVEVHDEIELEIALRLGARFIGVNNRNLKTLEISLETSIRMKSLIPKDVIAICESGIRSGTEIGTLSRLGYSGFLIGSSLMRTGKPGQTLKKLLQGVS